MQVAAPPVDHWLAFAVPVIGIFIIRARLFNNASFGAGVLLLTVALGFAGVVSPIPARLGLAAVNLWAPFAEAIVLVPGTLAFQAVAKRPLTEAWTKPFPRREDLGDVAVWHLLFFSAIALSGALTS